MKRYEKRDDEIIKKNYFKIFKYGVIKKNLVMVVNIFG